MEKYKSKHAEDATHPTSLREDLRQAKSLDRRSHRRPRARTRTGSPESLFSAAALAVSSPEVTTDLIQQTFSRV